MEILHLTGDLSIGIDLARANSGDYSALVVVRRLPDGRMEVVDHRVAVPRTRAHGKTAKKIRDTMVGLLEDLRMLEGKSKTSTTDGGSPAGGSFCDRCEAQPARNYWWEDVDCPEVDKEWVDLCNACHKELRGK